MRNEGSEMCWRLKGNEGEMYEVSSNKDKGTRVCVDNGKGREQLKGPGGEEKKKRRKEEKENPGMGNKQRSLYRRARPFVRLLEKGGSS